MPEPKPSADQTKDSYLGRIAYEAYCDTVGGVAFNGDPLPTWEQQCERSPKIAEAWRSASRAAVDEASTASQITGYQNLSPAHIDAINSIKAAEADIAELWKQLADVYPMDARWRAIARTHFEEGFSALVRTVAQPSSPFS